MKKKYNDEEYRLMLLEFTEAWSHFRHLEKNRNLYMSFFVSIILASIGFVIKVFHDSGNNDINTSVVFGIWSIAWFIDIVSTLMYTSVKKTGFSLKHYRNVIQRVRDEVYSEPETMNKLFWVGQRKKPIRQTKVLSVQGSAERLILSTIIILDIIQIILLVYSTTERFFPNIFYYVVFPLLIGIIAFQFNIINKISTVVAVDEPKKLIFYK